MESNDEDVFLTQSTFSSASLPDSEYDTDNAIQDILGMREDKENMPNYSPHYSDISDDDSLIQTAEKAEERDVLELWPNRFNLPKTDTEISELQSRRLAASTMSKVKWAVNTFKEWQDNRNRIAKNMDISPILVNLEEMTKDELNFSISKVDGSDYPSETMYSFVICIQLYLDTLDKRYKFLTDEGFLQIRNTLDNIMKEKSKNNVGGPKKQALPISEEEEDVMWSKHVLGDDTPEKLINTMVYLIGLNFALRGGQEHRNLRRGDRSQFCVGENEQGRYLAYTEDISKNNQGGLKHRKVSNKCLKHKQKTIDKGNPGQKTVDCDL
ncbi:uncharacterized protein LOC110445118 [Mizuhopecten yessoensis]|uniref:uncharacterized protein LOC110445118 n=1 Tax=Mizuhopecten yessoensis TaxID=6573 RepID=UPI000B457ABC|nr:uncharacterized protein LOC110445118 [Mizuhopecten yessoensis]